MNSFVHLVLTSFDETVCVQVSKLDMASMGPVKLVTDSITPSVATGETNRNCELPWLN